jgi:Mor family transcriptional regulator
MEITDIMSQLINLLSYFKDETLQLILCNLEELRSIRNQKIQSEFNGYNYQELAEKYQLDLRHIHRILKNKPLT